MDWRKEDSVSMPNRAFRGMTPLDALIMKQTVRYRTIILISFGVLILGTCLLLYFGVLLHCARIAQSLISFWFWQCQVRQG